MSASLTYIFLEQCEPGIKVKKSGIKVIQQGLASGSRLKVNMFWPNYKPLCLWKKLIIMYGFQQNGFVLII